MTLWDLPAAARRAWVLVLLGIVVTAGLVWHVTSVRPVYSAEVRVTLVAQTGARSLREPQAGLIVVAELISARIAAGKVARTSSESVSLISEGVRHGYSVTVPNRGNQWVQLVDRPDLRIEAVGLTRDDVRDELRSAVIRVEDELAALQVPLHLDPGARIHLSSATSVPEVSQGRGNAPRAVTGSILLGVAMTTAGLAVNERRRRIRLLRLRSLLGDHAPR